MNANNWTKKLLGIGMALSIALSMSACGKSDTPATTESTEQTTETTAPTNGADKKAPGSKDSKNNGKKPTDKTAGKKDDKTGGKANSKTDGKTDSNNNQPKENTTKETQPKEQKPEDENKVDSNKEQSPAPTQPKATEPAPTQPKETEPAHTHHYIAVTTPPSCITEGYTKYTCACGDGWVGDHTEMLGHNYSDWVTTVEPTVESEGQQTRTCSRCGETETRSIDKLPAPEPAVTEADIPALEAYARNYAQSVGFTIDTSLNLGNSGYFPPWGYNYTSLEHAKSVICEGIEATKSDLIASDGNDDGFTSDARYRYNCIIQINSDGEFVDYHLYG